MIYARFDDTHRKVLSMAVKGHAGAAEIGQDIVCASASILAYTVAQIATDMYKQDKLMRKPRIIMKKGSSSISCVPKDEYYDEALCAFFFAQTGMNLLSHNYPQYVSLKMFGQAE